MFVEQCGAPWRRRRAQSCLRGWRIRCCRCPPCPQTRRAALGDPSRRRRAGPYRLPHDVRDRLAAALAPFRNRDAAFALATFLGRFWSTPARLLAAFPIDRRELADACRPRPDGGPRARRDPGAGGGRVPRPGGGLRLDAQADAGRAAPQAGAVHVRELTTARCSARPTGGLRRPVSGVRGSARSGPAAVRRSSAGLPAARRTNSPKSKESEADKVIMGEIRTALAELPAPDSASSGLRSGAEPVQEGLRRRPAPMPVIKLSVGAAERTWAAEGQGLSVRPEVQRGEE